MTTEEQTAEVSEESTTDSSIDIQFPENGQTFSKEELGEVEQSEDNIESTEENVEESEEVKDESEAKDESDSQEEGQELNKEETPSKETDEQTLDDEEYFSTLTETTGVEVASDDDIVNKLKEYAEVKKELEELKSSDPLESLDPFIKDLAKAKKAGVDMDTYLSARSLDVEKMDTRDAMFQKYKLENAKSFERNPTLAERKFEKEYNAKYGGLNQELDPDDFESTEQYEEAVQEQQFNKMSLEDDADLAKEYLKNWQEENVTIPEADEQSGQVTEEELQKRIETYNNTVDQALQDLNGIEIPVGDKQFQFGLAEEDKQSLSEGLRDPQKLMAETFGIDLENDKIDVQKLGSVLSIVKAFNNEKLGDSLKKFAIENFNRETLEAKEANPKKVNTLGSAPETRTLKQKVADAFAAKRGR